MGKKSTLFTSVALPNTLNEMTMHLEDPKVAIVHQLPYTQLESSFAGVLDSVSLCIVYACMCVCMSI